MTSPAYIGRNINRLPNLSKWPIAFLEANRKPTTKRRRRCMGPEVEEGQTTHAYSVLVNQFKLDYYPGENVKMKRNKLFAMCDGTVFFSREEIMPYRESPLYQRVKDGMKIYKTFVHVHPVPLHGKFKLVSEI